MSEELRIKEFIEKNFNSRSLKRASRQEEQLSYILTSELQDTTVDQKYLTQWAERKYQTSDHFLNWIKIIFKAENFLSFFKYMRNPIPSTKIVRNRIEPQIRRVFNAEDSDFKYEIQGQELADFIGDLNIKQFNEEIFNRLLYKHNSVIIADLDKEIANQPIRCYVEVDNIVSILEKDDKIWKIAFSGAMAADHKIINGTFYIDNEVYAFIANEAKHSMFNVVIPHDLGSTPAHFIAPRKYQNNFIVRQSIYTFIREEIEEYNFLKILQKMTEPNGAIPVVTKIEAEEIKEESADKRGDEGQPSADNLMGSQQSRVFSENETVGDGDLQPGTIHEIPIEALRDDTGAIRTDAVTNYFTFHRIPIDALTYLNERVNELEDSIITTIVGDVVDSREEAKNTTQVEKSIATLDNTLNSFAEGLNRIRTLSDYDMLALKYGPDKVKEIFIHYGTDFFLDSTTKLFEDLEKAPNSLERKNIISRINRNRFKNNQDQVARQTLLYDLMPYVSDKDFDTALGQQTVSDVNKEYQIRFTYWIDQFESVYGDIVTFFRELDGTKAERLALINNLIIDLIKKDKEKNENGNPS